MGRHSPIQEEVWQTRFAGMAQGRGSATHTRGPPKGAPGIPSTLKYTCTYCHRPGHMADHCFRGFRFMRNLSQLWQFPWILWLQVIQPWLRSFCVFPRGAHFLPSVGIISMNGDTTPVTILRNLGSLQILIWVGVPIREKTGKYTVLSSCGDEVQHSKCYCRPSFVTVVPQLPVQGADLILGSDLAGEKVGFLALQKQPEVSAALQQLKVNVSHVSTLCTVNRYMTDTLQAFETCQLKMMLRRPYLRRQRKTSAWPICLALQGIVFRYSFAGVVNGRHDLTTAQHQMFHAALLPTSA